MSKSAPALPTRCNGGQNNTALEQTSGCGYLWEEATRNKKMRKYSLTILTVLMGLNLWAMAIASDFRCGTKLISAGDLKPRVLAECGDPTHVEVWHEERVYDYFAPYYYNDDFERERGGYRKPFLVKARRSRSHRPRAAAHGRPHATRSPLRRARWRSGCRRG